MGLKHRLHRALAPIIYRHGQAVVPGRVAHVWPQRRFTRQLLRELQIDCVLDVGANRGQFGRELRAIGYQGWILSFEPSPDSFALLEQEVAGDPRWRAFNLALGQEEGSATLHRMRMSVFNSFRRPTSAETLVHEAGNQIVDTVQVPIRRLDQLFPELRRSFRFSRPYLKTDTQGFDLEVFAGAAGVWPEIAALQAELSIKRIYEDTPTLTEALSTYEAGGFQLIEVFPVNPGDRPLVELDCFLQRIG